MLLVEEVWQELEEEVWQALEEEEDVWQELEAKERCPRSGAACVCVCHVCQECSSCRMGLVQGRQEGWAGGMGRREG